MQLTFIFGKINLNWITDFTYPDIIIWWTAILAAKKHKIIFLSS